MRIDGKESGGKHYIPEESDGLKGIKAAEAYRKISRENDTEIIAQHSGFSVEDVVTITGNTTVTACFRRITIWR